MRRRKKQNTRSVSEAGVALLTVLLMLAAMSAIAVAIMDQVRFDIRRSVNVRLRDQAYWYALGGEIFAQQIIEMGAGISPGRTTLNEQWAKEPVRLPLDNGSIAIGASDGGNCFNLNSVVDRAENGTLSSRELGIAQFIALLRSQGITETDSQSLAHSLADWIDSNTVPGRRGAEDYYYSGLRPSYRTGATLLADVTELRAIKGFSEEVYLRVRPYFCAHPNDELSTININTLREADAALLIMLVGSEQLSLVRAAELIERRPFDGYGRVEEFWADEVFANYTPSEEIVGQIALQTRYFNLRTEVVLDDTYFAMNSTFERERAGTFKLVSRSFGLPE